MEEERVAFHCDPRDGKGDLQISLPSFMNFHCMKTYVSTNALIGIRYWPRFPAQVKEVIAAFLLHPVHYFSFSCIASLESFFGNTLCSKNMVH